MTSNGLEVSDFMQQLRFRRGDLLGWDREPKKFWPTLTRKNASEPWGFSCVGGVDVMENGGRLSGIVTSRHERGLWLKVRTVRPGTAAAAAGLEPNDFISRINGRIVFHLNMKDVERLIETSGDSLLLDTERNVPKGMLYDSGINGTPLNFLYTDYKDAGAQVQPDRRTELMRKYRFYH